MDIILLTILGLGCLFFLFTSFTLIHNIRHFENLSDQKDFHRSEKQSKKKPVVSVLIPARNEENTILKLLDSLSNQDYPHIEIFVLDDGSTDNTASVVSRFSNLSNLPVNLLTGKQKPEGWMGKNWACHQLSKHANGEILLFLDADTWLAPSTVKGIITKMRLYQLGFTTVWPHQIMCSFAEKTIISMVYSTIVLYLPTLYSYQAPGWIPFSSLRTKVKPAFANACGQCMAFTKKCYNKTGGHSRVRNEVVEDVMLSKNVVSSGYRMRMFHGTDFLWCRMYRNHNEVLQGFRKNFLAGFHYKLLPFTAAWILHITVFLIPPVLCLLMLTSALPVSSNQDIILGIAAFLTAIPFLQRLSVTYLLKWPRITAILHLPGILWFQVLAIIVIRDYLLKTTVNWKGRGI